MTKGKNGGEIVEIYRKNKKNRSIDNIQEEQNMLEEQKKREDSRRRQKLREDTMRQISEKKKIQEKEAEELRDNKGAEKTEKYVNNSNNNIIVLQ